MDRLSQGPRYAAWFFGCFALLIVSLPITPALADEAGWRAAERPGAIILMRHALAPGTGDPAEFDISDCGTQRNLSDEGRDQARRIGDAFEERGIDIEKVLTSQWCRCRETAELLGLASVEDFPALNSFFENRSNAELQTREALQRLRNLPDDGRTVLVTHQVNISALANVFPRSGEAIIVDISPDGALDIQGRILIDP